MIDKIGGAKREKFLIWAAFLSILFFVLYTLVINPFQEAQNEKSVKLSRLMEEEIKLAPYESKSSEVTSLIKGANETNRALKGQLDALAIKNDSGSIYNNIKNIADATVERNLKIAGLSIEPSDNKQYETMTVSALADFEGIKRFISIFTNTAIPVTYISVNRVNSHPPFSLSAIVRLESAIIVKVSE